MPAKFDEISSRKHHHLLIHQPIQHHYELQTLSVNNLEDQLNAPVTTTALLTSSATESPLFKSKSLDKFNKIREFALDGQLPDHHQSSYLIQPANRSPDTRRGLQSMPMLDANGNHQHHNNNNNPNYHNNANGNFSMFKKFWLQKNPYGMNRFDSIASSGYGSEFTIDSPVPSQPNTPLPEEVGGCCSSVDSVIESEIIWTHSSIERSGDFSSLDELSTSPSLPTPTVSPPPDERIQVDPKGPKRNDYIRKVNRLGQGLEDNCKFPLALPMDGSDVYKGASTWESITLLADCVLKSWEDAAANRRKRPVNRTLPNAARYLQPNNTLEAAIIQHPDVRLPFRRNNSELDLTKLGYQQRQGLVPFGGEGQVKRVRAPSQDDINLNIHLDKAKKLMIKENRPPARSRAFSTISLRKTSIGSLNNKTMERTDTVKSRSETNKNRSGSIIMLQKLGPKRPRAESLLDVKTIRKKMYDPKALARTIKIESPVSMALQISRIEKELIMNLPVDDVMQLVIKRGRTVRDQRNSDLKRLLGFGQELSNLVVDIISREPNPELRGKKIAAVIEVACVLRKLRNWQSMVSWIRGLQSPKVYSMASAWAFTKSNYSVHFNDYIKLCRVVHLNQTGILRSRQPCLPSLQSWVSLLRLRCAATWDRLENRPRWTEPPTLVAWLERQLIIMNMANNTATENGDQHEHMANGEQTKNNDEIEKEGLRLRNRKRIGSRLAIGINGLNGYRNSDLTEVRKSIDRCINEMCDDDRLSFLPKDDPIYFIYDDQLPKTWTGRSVRNIPAEFHGKIIRSFHNSYDIELANIDKFAVAVAI